MANVSLYGMNQPPVYSGPPPTGSSGQVLPSNINDPSGQRNPMNLARFLEMLRAIRPKGATNQPPINKPPVEE